MGDTPSLPFIMFFVFVRWLGHMDFLLWMCVWYESRACLRLGQCRSCMTRIRLSKAGTQAVSLNLGQAKSAHELWFWSWVCSRGIISRVNGVGLWHFEDMKPCWRKQVTEVELGVFIDWYHFHFVLSVSGVWLGYEILASCSVTTMPACMHDHRHYGLVDFGYSI